MCLPFDRKPRAIPNSIPAQDCQQTSSSMLPSLFEGIDTYAYLHKGPNYRKHLNFKAIYKYTLISTGTSKTSAPACPTPLKHFCFPSAESNLTYFDIKKEKRLLHKGHKKLGKWEGSPNPETAYQKTSKTDLINSSSPESIPPRKHLLTHFNIT